MTMVGAGEITGAAVAEQDGSEHLLHAGDLGGLIDVDVGGELEHGLVLRGAVRAEQILTIDDGALVVLDHVGEEQPVELRAARLRPAPSSASSVSMPGISISCSMPFIFIFMPGVRSGTGWPRSPSQRCIVAISSVLRVDDPRGQRLRPTGWRRGSAPSPPSRWPAHGGRSCRT